MSSYQYRDSHVKDKTVSPTVLSLTWESPYLGKTVFILRRDPGNYAPVSVSGSYYIVTSVMISGECIKSTKLHPSLTELDCSVSKISTYISTHLQMIMKMWHVNYPNSIPTIPTLKAIWNEVPSQQGWYWEKLINHGKSPEIYIHFLPNCFYHLNINCSDI